MLEGLWWLINCPDESELAEYLMFGVATECERSSMCILDVNPTYFHQSFEFRGGHEHASKPYNRSVGWRGAFR